MGRNETRRSDLSFALLRRGKRACTQTSLSFTVPNGKRQMTPVVAKIKYSAGPRTARRESTHGGDSAAPAASERGFRRATARDRPSPLRPFEEWRNSPTIAKNRTSAYPRYITAPRSRPLARTMRDFE
jgi:hypothetical protein